MYRTDFERVCLDKALELIPDDARALSQFGDHLKRIGHYDEALEALGQAKVLTNDPVIASTIADIWACRGEYQEAIRLYRSIPNWRTSATIRTAIADNMRRAGDLASAWKEYDKLEQEGASDRVLAGKAEIEKHQGNLQKARDIYKHILSLPDIEPAGRIIYRLALADILKQEGDFREAYKTVRKVMRDAPFVMHARILEASLLGLSKRAQQGLEKLPQHREAGAYGEWLTQYYRGLLLLQLERPEEAKGELLKNLKDSLAVGEEKVITRLAAALAHLRNSELQDAAPLLEEVGDVHDAYLRHLAGMLQLHLATVRHDTRKRKAIIKSLRKEEIGSRSIRRAIGAINRGEFSSAFQHEISAFLQFAAA